MRSNSVQTKQCIKHYTSQCSQYTAHPLSNNAAIFHFQNLLLPLPTNFLKYNYPLLKVTPPQSSSHTPIFFLIIREKQLISSPLRQPYYPLLTLQRPSQQIAPHIPPPILLCHQLLHQLGFCRHQKPRAVG